MLPSPHLRYQRFDVRCYLNIPEDGGTRPSEILVFYHITARVITQKTMARVIVLCTKGLLSKEKGVDTVFFAVEVLWSPINQTRDGEMEKNGGKQYIYRSMTSEHRIERKTF